MNPICEIVQNAKELEQGYLELQKKLGSNEEEEGEEEGEEEDEEYEEGEDDEEYEYDEEYEDDEEGSILDELWDEDQSEDEFSDEIIDRIKEMDPEDLAVEYLNYRNSVENDADFSEADVQELKAAAGGEEQYTQMVSWAKENLSEQETDMFDAGMQKGDPLAAFFAIRVLAMTYENEVGSDGTMIQGKAPRSSSSQFRSQAEVVEAISDPRYEKDPAYRADVTAKLERSNVNF